MPPWSFLKRPTCDAPSTTPRSSKQRACGIRMELWSWLYGDLDDFCAERCRDFCILILTFKHPSQIGPDSSVFVLQEASELSSLKPQLEELGVPLVAVVKENLGSEIQDFRPHFAGDIYIDEEKRFYGPLQRRMGGLGFLRIGVWQNFIRAWKSGYQGNMNGEGFILGGVYVIGAGEQRIILEHREKQFGDKVDTADVLKAIQKIVPAK
uniref:Peroxiredoxin-like 2A n=1 Tax=Oryzias sinensis TaxID=183150 RepID=A0A8C8A0Q2_9TELE